MIIHLVCAARPNFMKIAPLYHALRKEDWAGPVIVHTGQHYDTEMSDAFFDDLGLPRPDVHLGVQKGSHAEQTAGVLRAYERTLLERRPDLVVAAGDVNSTLAATLAAVKLGVKVAHLEAGLRSHDRTMPEELNRLVTDVLADWLWTPSPDATENLLREGIPQERIRCVGNIMIDSFEMLRTRIEQEEAWREFGLGAERYGVVTLHRPSNVDAPAVLERICRSLENLSGRIALLFPVHPRTRNNLERFGLLPELLRLRNLILSGPLGYIRFMSLVSGSRFVLTDSGGVQEETSYLGIPCFTVRKNTERPVTVTEGTNRLCELDGLERMIYGALQRPARVRTAISLWDGNTAHRIVELLREMAGKPERHEPAIGTRALTNR